MGEVQTAKIAESIAQAPRETRETEGFCEINEAIPFLGTDGLE